MAWYSAYHKLGKLSAGFDVWVKTQTQNDDCSYFEAELALNAKPQSATLLLNLKEDQEYQATWNGDDIPLAVLESGTLQLSLPQGAEQGQLIVKTRS
ncbi:hypothetical protein JCM19231_1964 [Vibrio ishigakensis]|uniref:Uncharacterized protein n=1 Tax=Vibrio ishigakensis TaxID=1481914 RepID=A0A0B8NVK1_9VIBR|nr:hypothetical protein JCM19231_1964 [Vibrio ishigakensis]